MKAVQGIDLHFEENKNLQNWIFENDKNRNTT